MSPLTAPCGARPPDFENPVLAPRRNFTSYGATALEVHEMNRHSRKYGGKPSCQHVPEEVSHGENLLSEECPTAAT